MKTKQIVKILIAVAMMLLLVALMAYMLTGQMLHEWLGTFMVVLFVIHHFLNVKWIKNFLKGKYNSFRFINTALNVLLCMDMVALAVSGVMMSGYVFSVIPIHSGIALFRRVHMVAGFWGLIFMSLHLGFHWSAMAGIGGKMFHIKTAGRKGLSL